MNKFNQDNYQWQNSSNYYINGIPTTFEEAARMIQQFALREIAKATKPKQLYYHNCTHALKVKRRANIIFSAIAPFYQPNKDDLSKQRLKQLLDISAIAHDLVQNFLPVTKANTARKRETGVSETATISKLLEYIDNLNQKFGQKNCQSSVLFTDTDKQIITEAIEATICLYDPSDRSLYQPDLYNPEKQLSLPAKILALADLGTLGIEGVEPYLEEGSLIFLEENPDVIPLIISSETVSLHQSESIKVWEQLRQRLLKRAKFQIDFARGREARLERELQGLPPPAIAILKEQIFHHLNKTTIQYIELLTPTFVNSSIENLLTFFKLKKYIKYLDRDEQKNN